MQAMEVEEHFLMQHAYATLGDLSYFKRNLTVTQGMTPLSLVPLFTELTLT